MLYFTKMLLKFLKVLIDLYFARFFGYFSVGQKWTLYESTQLKSHYFPVLSAAILNMTSDIRCTGQKIHRIYKESVVCKCLWQTVLYCPSHHVQLLFCIHLVRYNLHINIHILVTNEPVTPRDPNLLSDDEVFFDSPASPPTSSGMTSPLIQHVIVRGEMTALIGSID